MMRTGLVLLMAGILSTAGCVEQIRNAVTDDVGPRDYLHASDYREWVIEIDHMGGHRPDAQVTDLLKARITPVVNKPDGVRTIISDSLPAQGQEWTIDGLQNLARDYRDQKTGGGTVVTHVLFVDGHSAADSDRGRVLGVAIGWDLVVIFSETIKETCSLGSLCFSSANEIMGAVLVHEFGHIMGLVHREDGDGNVPVPKQSPHEASECNGRPDSGHSTNRNSVMFCAVESSNIVNLLRGGVPTQFDAADKADLCAAGGRC